MKNSQKDLNKRSLWYGMNSIFVAMIGIALIGVINFLGNQYPQKLDLTKNKIHTFSDQSQKVMKGLKSEMKATFYGDINSREKNRAVFDNYKKLSNQFKFELVDPNKEPTRAKNAGIKKMETLVLTYQGRVAKIEEITEEKITNEIIRLTKDAKTVVCTVVGHGELSFNDVAPNAFAAAKKGIEDQSYEVKEVLLPQQTSIPTECSLLVMMGTSKALFPAEMKMLSDYLSTGGRLVLGVDATIAANDQIPEMKTLLKTWGIEVKSGLVIDPVSKMLGVDASVPIITTFNKDSQVVKDFNQQCYFPFARPLELTSPAPEGLSSQWLAKTTPKAWGELNMASIAKGEVQFNEGADLKGPLIEAVSVNGKLKGSNATKETRIVVFGTSQFANTQYSKLGQNIDLFLNSISWAIEDTNLISIRSKVEQAGQIELSQNQSLTIFWTCVIIIPIFIAIFGIVIWVRRKKL